MKKILLGIVIGLSIAGVSYAAELLVDAKSISYSSEYTTSNNVADALNELLENAGSCPLGFKCEEVCTPLSTTTVGETLRYAGLDWKVISTDESGTNLILVNNYTTGAFDENGSKTYAGSTSYNILNDDLIEDKELLKDKVDYNCLASQGKYNNKDYYVRLPEKDELSENISNDSETPFWTQTADDSGVYFALKTGIEGVFYTANVQTYYEGTTTKESCAVLKKDFIVSLNEIQTVNPSLTKVDTSYTSTSEYVGTSCSYTTEQNQTYCHYSAGNLYAGGMTNRYYSTGTCNKITHYTLISETLGIRPVVKVKKI